MSGQSPLDNLKTSHTPSQYVGRHEDLPQKHRERAASHTACQSVGWHEDLPHAHLVSPLVGVGICLTHTWIGLGHGDQPHTHMERD